MSLIHLAHSRSAIVNGDGNRTLSSLMGVPLVLRAATHLATM